MNLGFTGHLPMRTSHVLHPGHNYIGHSYMGHNYVTHAHFSCSSPGQCLPELQKPLGRLLFSVCLQIDMPDHTVAIWERITSLELDIC